MEFKNAEDFRKKLQKNCEERFEILDFLNEKIHWISSLNNYYRIYSNLCKVDDFNIDSEDVCLIQNNNGDSCESTDTWYMPEQYFFMSEEELVNEFGRRIIKKETEAKIAEEKRKLLKNKEEHDLYLKLKQKFNN